MSVLVLAEHDNRELKPATLHTVTAARALADEVHLLVAGSGCDAVAQAAASVEGVTKVRICDAEHYAHALAEPLAALLASLAADYGYVLAPATTFGKNVLPRVAGTMFAILAASRFVSLVYIGISGMQVGNTTGFDFAYVNDLLFGWGLILAFILAGLALYGEKGVFVRQTKMGRR